MRTKRKIKKKLKAKQAALLHASSTFDANERALDWFPNHKDSPQYVDLLVDVIVGELPDILSNEYTT